MANAREYVVNGVLVNETATRQYVVNGVLINETIVVGGATTILPQMMQAHDDENLGAI